MVTKSWMEVLSPTSAYFPNSTWILGEKRSGNWTEQENKIFENALAHIDSRIPDRWARVAAMLPGKTVKDVISHYRDLEDDVNHIEAGLIPCPGYSSSSLSFDWEGDGGGYNGKAYCVGGKRGRFTDQERKKGVPWTEEEHKLFLMGLNKHGKGDWRNISRNFVVTRTPTQVASHAQKYFNRLNSGGKDKRRASIHDITIANLAESDPTSPSQPSGLMTLQSTTAVTPGGRSDQFSVVVGSDQSKEAARVFSPSLHGNGFVQVPNGMNPYGIKMELQNSYRGMLHDSMIGHHMMLI